METLLVGHGFCRLLSLPKTHHIKMHSIHKEGDMVALYSIIHQFTTTTFIHIFYKIFIYMYICILCGGGSTGEEHININILNKNKHIFMQMQVMFGVHTL